MHDLPEQKDSAFFLTSSLRHLVFAQSVGAVETLKLVFNGPLWSIVLEMYFYLAFPLLLLLIKPLNSLGKIIAAFIVGFIMLIIAFNGYAFSTQGWQMYPWMALAALSGFVTPAFQSIMTSQIPANAQGELQGALSSLNSITSIIGPLFMTQLFAGFTGPEAPFYFPGVSFFVAALLSAISLFIFVPVVRSYGLTALGKA
ncbi:MAG: hypothetical protein QGG02_10900 [Gammaproteobacteria bacterium]|jgi:peptidoglycan/LPS O-acetylase OafA/YrhL|nr:hypothetical protein [Gammaproteobacteria bacterium]MDP6731394.1 hypothetical protein [Gammaproteobacteria bacterium]|tara:strand:- start:105 stop:704 length:600 start_codon:yes stop_codon:yes gene_type:complete